MLLIMKLKTFGDVFPTCSLMLSKNKISRYAASLVI